MSTLEGYRVINDTYISTSRVFSIITMLAEILTLENSCDLV